jgi:isopenicillin N synthase-like dioxygenase
MDTLQNTRIAVIDLGPYLAGEPGALERTGAELGAAAEELGFYFVANHGVPQALIDRVFEQADRFHSLPEERKLEVRVQKKVVGYLPLGGQTQRLKHSGHTHPDRSASFYVKDEYPPDHPYRLAGHNWVFDNRWPRDLPGFREMMLEYYKTMTGLFLKLLPLQSVALGLPADYLSNHPAFNPSVNTLRLICYPPRAEENEGQYGISPHTDFGYMTLLAQATRPGLELVTRGGEWIQAPAPEGCFLANMADMGQRWTNDRFRSTPHRVINLKGETRYSIPFFCGARWDVTLDCLPTCHSADNPPKYEPLSTGEYMTALQPKIYDALYE